MIAEKKIIINADDFGLHKSINEAAEEAHKRGILTSASLVVNGEAFDSAVSVSKRNNGLGVGFHLNLISGFPVSHPEKIKTILDVNGMFLENHWQLCLKILKGEVDIKEIIIETRAQLDKLYGNGLIPTHIDSHRHLHFFPPIFEAIQPVLKEYNITRMRYLNIPYFEFRNIFSFRNVAAFFLKYYSLLNKKRHKHADFFYGFFDPGRMDKTHFLYLLNKIKPVVTEINFHPGKSNEEIGKKYGFWNMYFLWKFDWEKEYSVLMDDEIKNFVKKNNITLINYSSL